MFSGTRGAIGRSETTARRVGVTVTGDCRFSGRNSSCATKVGNCRAIALAIAAARSGLESVTVMFSSTVSSGLSTVTCPARLWALVVSRSWSITTSSTFGW